MRAADFSKHSPGRLVPTIGGASAFLPARAPRTLAFGGSTVRLLARAEHRLGELTGATSRLVDPHLIGARLLQQEAILSSRIEGTYASAEQMALFDLGAGPRTPDEREVGNFIRASSYAHNEVRKGNPIVGRLILEAHRMLMKGVRGDRERPGEYRSTQNFIGSSQDIAKARYVPPPPTELPALLSDLEHFINEDSPELPLLARTAIAHYQFEAIHPFRDGNGRIGRLLIALMFVRDGLLSGPLLPLSSAFERDRVQYADALLSVSTRGDWNAWLSYFFSCVAESGAEALTLVAALEALRDEWHTRLHEARTSALLLKLVDALFARPATTIAEATRLLRVTTATASANIRRLEQLGILRETTGRTRDRIYLAQEIIDLMTRHTNSGGHPTQ